MLERASKQDVVPDVLRHRLNIPKKGFIKEAKLIIRNPKFVKMKGVIRPISYATAVAQAKKAGHDGVIILNTVDGGRVDTIYVVFKTSQIIVTAEESLGGGKESKFGPTPQQAREGLSKNIQREERVRKIEAATARLELRTKLRAEGVAEQDLPPKLPESDKPTKSEQLKQKIADQKAKVPVQAVEEAKPAKPIPITRLRKQARNLDVDISDIERKTGKAARAELETRIEEAKAGRPSPERGTAPLTPEEQFTLAQSEGTLSATEGLAVHPNLYIGNVTDRMQRVFGEALDVAPEKIGSFREGGWIVNRTKIELTMGEAREELIRLEQSIDFRLDNNQIVTHGDMARMNADWGDVKTLREVLGLPIGKRPFRVIQGARTEVVTITRAKERIEKAVTPSKLDLIKITKIDRLNQSLRQLIKGIKEGHKLGSKEAKENFAIAQYLRKQVQMRKDLIKKIGKPPSKKIDPFFREAITSVQNTIDFMATGNAEKLKREKASRRDFLERHPEGLADMPQKLLDALDKTDVGDLSFADLQLILGEMNRLRQLGLAKSRTERTLRDEKIDAFGKTAVNTVKNARKKPLGKIRSIDRAINLRSLRIFDMLDGGQKFDGPLTNFFSWTTNENTSAELLNTDMRHAAMTERRNDLGVSLNDLATLRTIGDLTLTLDEFLSIYVGEMNLSSKMALRHGGALQRVDGKDEFVRVTDKMFRDIEAALTPSEKEWAHTILAEYAEHYPRLRETRILIDGRDPGFEDNYSKILRIDIDYIDPQQEIEDEMERRKYWRQEGPDKANTIVREKIPDAFQKPIKLGLTMIHHSEVRKQEHYIAHAPHIKDMRSVINQRVVRKTGKTDETGKPISKAILPFRDAVVEKFGKSVMKTVDEFVSKIANPDYYRANNGIERASRVLRKNMTVAYLAGNFSTIAIQGPSLMLYAPYSSVADLIATATVGVFNPKKLWDQAKEIHPELVSRSSIDRDMDAILNADPIRAQKILNKVGRVGFAGIIMMDRTVKAIGIVATFNKAKRDGLSDAEAKRKAILATLLTQPTPNPKDLARLYSTNEVLNSFLMFTNQLNQIYNIITHDIPAAWRQGEYQFAARSTMALSMFAVLVWIVKNKRLPTSLEEIADAHLEQAARSIPLFGGNIANGIAGWQPNIPAPIESAVSAGRAVVALSDGDVESAIRHMVEPVATGFGIPYQGPKNIINLIEAE